MVSYKPLKRDPAIVSFSNDHHIGLLLVWKIRKGINYYIDISRISDYILFVFKNHLKQHFLEEEELLFSVLSNDNAMRIAAENDHMHLTSLIEKIETKPGSTNTIEFADKPEQHIRFEERILFNHLRDNLNEQQLTSIAQQMGIRPDTFNEDKWEDTFWIKNETVLN